jgi:hypothetical protein
MHNKNLFLAPGTKNLYAGKSRPAAAALARGLVVALLLVMTGRGAYALEDLPLANTQTVSLAGAEGLSINYGGDDVILRESDGDDLIIREYIKTNRPRYYARISRSGPRVYIKQGSRPWLAWFWKARAEIYLPRSFRGDLALVNHSGNLSAETNLLDYKTIDISVGSGSVYLNRLSGQTLSVRVSSGSLDIAGITGSLLASVSSGKLQIGDLAGPEHRIKLTSGRIRTGSVQGSSHIVVSSGTITLEKALGRMEADISSGSVLVDNFSGEGSFELSAGNLALDLAELSGDLRFRLSSGSVEMGLPRNLSFNLDAVTNSGTVQVDDGGEPLRVSGNSTVLRPFGPAPERTIFARISSGKLAIHRR